MSEEYTLNTELPDFSKVLEAAQGELDLGNYDEATRLALQLRSAADPLSREGALRLASVMRVLGGVARMRGEYAKALEDFSEAMRLSERVEDQEGVAKALNSLGNVYRNLSDYTTAIDYYSRALTIDEELDLKEGVATCLGNIGIVHRILANYPKALEFISRALALDEELSNRTGVALWLGNLGNVYLSLSENHKALDYYSRALAMNEELGFKNRVAMLLGNIGVIHAGLSDYPKALDHHFRSLSLAEELGTKEQIASSLANIGTVYLTLSDYSKALDFFVRALAVEEDVGNKIGVSNCLTNIGTVYLHLSDFARALEYYSRALTIDEALGNKVGVSRDLGCIGNVHEDLLDYTQALDYNVQAMAIVEELGDKGSVALRATNIGNVYGKLSNYPKALEYLSRALSTFEELGSKTWIAACMHNIAVIYANENFQDYDAILAEEYLKKALSMFEALSMSSEQYEVHLELANLYEKLKRWEDFAIHYKRYHHLKDIVLNDEARKKAEYLEQQKQMAIRDSALAAERATAVATTSILYKVLPSSVADRLINGEKVADYFQHISILFADIVGFTPIAARMPAKAVLAFLNYVFGEFDRVMEKHGCQKIKTIGDGYMAVCGAPFPCDDHAERLARAALELMSDIELPESLRLTLPKGSVFHLRIGLHTGSAFAGIVGEKGFVYDVYSDAVNLAARMESSGEAGRIHCSSDFTYHLQNRDESFVFEERGEIEVKGKGVMRTYFLERQ